MERSLGKLSAAVRSKDAEIASLQTAMHEQFAERNGLRSTISGLDSQLLRLQGSYGELEARLRESEEERGRLHAAQNMCGALVPVCVYCSHINVWAARWLFTGTHKHNKYTLCNQHISCDWPNVYCCYGMLQS
jgi:hypothetical protein